MVRGRCLIWQTAPLALALACGGANVKGSYQDMVDEDDEMGDWEDTCIDDEGQAGPDEMDIIGISILPDPDGADTLVRIIFAGDNRAYMEEHNVAGGGVAVTAQFSLEGGDFIDSWTTSGGGFKVSDGKAGVEQDWSGDGSEMLIRYTGFAPSRIMSGTIEASRYDTYVGSYCDSVEIVNSPA